MCSVGLGGAVGSSCGGAIDSGVFLCVMTHPNLTKWWSFDNTYNELCPSGSQSALYTLDMLCVVWVQGGLWVHLVCATLHSGVFLCVMTHPNLTKWWSFEHTYNELCPSGPQSALYTLDMLCVVWVQGGLRVHLVCASIDSGVFLGVMTHPNLTKWWSFDNTYNELCPSGSQSALYTLDMLWVVWG